MKKLRKRICYLHEGFAKFMLHQRLRALMMVIITTFSLLGFGQQGKEITGTVSDNDNRPLPGVSVLIKGTTMGTLSDLNGRFTLPNVPPNSILIFSFVGMKTQEIPVGNLSVINVTLSEEAIGLEEVVVTALGISREKKQLNYSIQKIDGDLLATTGNIDVSKGLQGKIAGVTVRQTSGAPGRTTKVTIRGSNSITGSNNPLFVVDGSPIDANVALNINPNEIESMNVLKGATASALYGLRASNGVILIETKRGRYNQMYVPTITINSTYSFDRLAVYPELQTSYGQGVRGNFDPYSAYSFGPKISEWGTYVNQLGEQEVARAYDNVRSFFRTGGTLDSHISVSNKFDRGNYSIGVAYSDQQGIIPKTEFNRIAVTIGGDYKITKNLDISTSVNYSDNGIDSFKEEGGSGSLFYAAYGAPPSYDYKNKPTHVEGNPYQQINFRGQHDNIYWILDNSGDVSKTSTLIGSVNLNYNPLKWLKLNYRIGLDQISGTNKQVYGFGSGATAGRTVPPSGGQVSEGQNTSRSINSTFLSIINHKIADVIDLEFLAGNEFYDYDYRSLSATGTGFTIPDLHHLSNCNVITNSQYWGRKRTYAFFGNLNLNYSDMISLTVSARNDVVSNMPRDNRSFFYPSIGLGFVFTEAMDMPDFITFGKIRASYAQVGQAGGIYNTSTVYTRSGAGRFPFPYQGINAFSRSSNLKSTDLEPENTKSWEVGANIIFFQNRINLDYSYYNSRSEGQIFSVPVSITTGFASETRNAGEMKNHGHELVLGIKPVVINDFIWDITTNFTAFTNKVTKLAEGVDELSLGGASYVAYVVAREKEHYPVLRGYGYARDPEGRIVVNSVEGTNYGVPLRTPSADIIFGKADPDFEINFLNTLKYRSFTLYTQIDWREGGVIGSGDIRLQKLYGTFYDTKFREEDYLEPNSVKGYYDSEGKLVILGENDIVIKRDYDYWRTMDGLGEQNVYDASFIRVREIKLNFDVPAKLLGRIKIKSASVYAVGRNLWLIKSGLPYYDPEMNNSTGNDIGYTSTAYPQISNYGLGLNLVF